MIFGEFSKLFCRCKCNASYIAMTDDSLNFRMDSITGDQDQGSFRLLFHNFLDSFYIGTGGINVGNRLAVQRFIYLFRHTM